MPENRVKPLCESTRQDLKEVMTRTEQFLNDHTLLMLMKSDSDPSMEEFYRGFLADLRHLLVFSEVVYEKLGISLRRPEFNVEYAEKALYETYHSCINRFFYPKHECYSEDGRYAYTGQDAIRFRKKPTREVRDLVVELSKIFEDLRDRLAYYENDYLNQRRLQGERI